MEPHATRIVVWDVPTAVECGAPFKLKVGVKCAAECGGAGRRVEIRDGSGELLAAGIVGDVPLPGTSALHYAELELGSPAVEGLHSLQACVAEVVDTATGRATHSAARAKFGVCCVQPPECVLRVFAVDSRSHEPVPGAKVVVHPFHARTNGDGIAALRIPKGAYRLFVTGRDRFPFRSDGQIEGDMTIRAELDADFGPSDAELWS